MIDSNGAAHARNGRYTNKKNTAAADGLIQPDARSVAAEEALDAAFAARKAADRGVAEARVGIIAANVAEHYPDTATIVLANSPSGKHTSWQPAALPNTKGDVIWEFNRDPQVELPDDDWVMIGEVFRQVQAIGSEYIDAVLPRQKRTPLTKRAFDNGWVTHAGPRVINVG